MTVPPVYGPSPPLPDLKVINLSRTKVASNSETGVGRGGPGPAPGPITGITDINPLLNAGKEYITDITPLLNAGREPITDINPH